MTNPQSLDCSEAVTVPVSDAFLDFLEKDIISHPERLTPLTEQQVRHMAELTQGVEIDLDAPLPEEN